jgi:D-alanyl-D-alanine carboxypeptidase
MPDAWSKVTLRRLLDPTSGLPSFTGDPDFLVALGASLKNAPPPRKLLSYVEDKPLNFIPGSRYRYFNSDNVTVALMVEALTGRTYEGQLQEQVYRPLGLRRLPYRQGPISECPTSTATTTTHRKSRPRT